MKNKNLKFAYRDFKESNFVAFPKPMNFNYIKTINSYPYKFLVEENRFHPYEEGNYIELYVYELDFKQFYKLAEKHRRKRLFIKDEVIWIFFNYEF